MTEGIRSKQCPVEDLLDRADGLIEAGKQKQNQAPVRAEVYAAMAQSLGAAWRDLNAALDRKGQMLEHNFLFHGHFQVNSIKKICFCNSVKYSSSETSFTCKVTAFCFSNSCWWFFQGGVTISTLHLCSCKKFFLSHIARTTSPAP